MAEENPENLDQLNRKTQDDQDVRRGPISFGNDEDPTKIHFEQLFRELFVKSGESFRRRRVFGQNAWENAGDQRFWITR